MRIEVEQKFTVADRAALERRLTEMATTGPPTRAVQIDNYFAHPSRDFASTDEALRLRYVDEHNYITYKGPKLDTTTKTRREIELALPDGSQAAAESAELLEVLGFRRVAQVKKRRDHMVVEWQSRPVEVSLDEVEGLGTFVELEILADQSELEAARACMTSLCEHLNLGKGERRSYLELLLAERE